jgi:uncharacterized protein
MRNLAILLFGMAMWGLAAQSSAFALSLEDAKANGMVGERSNGYLGTVTTSNPEAVALTSEINQKRRQAYEEIANRNRTPLKTVETLAGEKAIQNTKTGNFVETPSGWVKK